MIRRSDKVFREWIAHLMDNGDEIPGCVSMGNNMKGLV